jgi:tripartite-type tricarboxylate transporter receptor subunit TctC
MKITVSDLKLVAGAALAIGAALCAPTPARAAYPERSITVVCASGAGGIVDVTTRIIVDHMSRTLGRPIVVQNEAGAGSTLAIATVAKAAPDGYTVLTIGPGVGVVHELYPTAKVDVRRDLAPVSIMGLTPMVLLTHKDVPVSDYASLLAYIKAHPGEPTYGSNGRGSSGHLAGALFKKMAGADIRYIPYRTTPQAQADLIGGRLSMMWLSTLTDHIQAGTLRPIAVSTVARWKLFPDTPTFDELGLKGYEAATWVSMYLPTGAPPEAVNKLNEALELALANPAVRARLDQVGIIVPPTMGPQANGKYLKNEIEKWSDILRNNKDE